MSAVASAKANGDERKTAGAGSTTRTRTGTSFVAVTVTVAVTVVVLDHAFSLRRAPIRPVLSLAPAAKLIELRRLADRVAAMVWGLVRRFRE